MTPLASESDNNLLPLGSFEDFWAGASAPGGPFSAPRHSSIRREQRLVADGNCAVREEWEQWDWGTPPEEHFGTLLEVLRPNTPYRFSMQADTLDSFSGYLVFYLEDGAGKRRQIGEIPFAPKRGYKPYDFPFQSGEFTRLRAAAYGPENPAAYPSSVVWDDWRLTESDTPVPPPAAVPQQSGGRIANGSFEFWPTGVFPPPGSFTMPAAGDVFTLSRCSGDAAEGRHALRQTWHKTDAGQPVKHFCKAKIGGLEANTWHTLHFKAKVTEGEFARIVAFGLDDSGAGVKPLESRAVSASGGYRSYELRFNTGAYTAVGIAMKGPWQDNAAFPVTVLWDDFQFEE